MRNKINHKSSVPGGHIIQGLLERLTADFLQNGPLECLRPFKDSVKNVPLKIKPNVLKSLFNLFLRPCHPEVLLVHSKRREIFWEQQLNCRRLICVILFL